MCSEALKLKTVLSSVGEKKKQKWISKVWPHQWAFLAVTPYPTPCGSERTVAGDCIPPAQAASRWAPCTGLCESLTFLYNWKAEQSAGREIARHLLKRQAGRCFNNLLEKPRDVTILNLKFEECFQALVSPQINLINMAKSVYILLHSLSL